MIPVIKGIEEVTICTVMLIERFNIGKLQELYPECGQYAYVRNGWMSSRRGNPSRIELNFSTKVSEVYLTLRM